VHRSTDRILSTHCGSLPRPRELLAPLHAKDSGLPHDRDALAAGVRRSVADVVRRQVETGIDVVNDGEHSKSSFAHYARTRIGGLTVSDEPRRRLADTSRDAIAFPGVYEEMKVMFAARAALTQRPQGMSRLICTGPITYIGQVELKTDIDNLKAALGAAPATEAFITAISPTNLELYFANQFYRSDEDYLAALAQAMNQEYRAIVDAGFLLQIDDPRLITHYNRSPGMTIEECRKFIALRVEAVNHALEGIPEDRVRFHTCYSVNVAPRVHDLELRHYVDLMLRIKAGSRPGPIPSRPPIRDTSTNGRSGRRSSCRPARSLFRAWSRTASIRSSTPSSSRSASNASQASSAARTSWPATTAALRPPPPATRFIPMWRGRSSPRWSRARGSRRSDFGRRLR
jgi:5-methyltetrahydropteroyltriglutamate--homocysteine methyltransferase